MRLKNKILGYLGLAARGHFLLFGEEQWERVKKGMVCFLANDAKEETQHRVFKKASKVGVSVLTSFSKEELSSVTSKSNVVVLIVTNYSLARQIQKILDMKGE